MDWRSVLFGWPPRVKPAPKKEEEQGAAQAEPATDVVSPPSEEAVYAHMPEAEAGSAQQHRWLFDEGVLHWNQRRHESDFLPKFAGINFVKEAPKTRLWGRPADIIGDERVLLGGVDWSFADLQGATLARADLRNARLVGANLRNANLAGALLNGADLTDCDLRGANLDGAQLARTTLVHANMTGASTKDANFAWADLTHASIGARALQEANLFGAVRHAAPKPARRGGSAAVPLPAQIAAKAPARQAG
jgi:hypothetical protein